MTLNKPINAILYNFLITIFVTFLTLGVSLAADSDLDLSFNGNGKVITNIGDGTDDSKAIAIQSDGKIVVAGTSSCCSYYSSEFNFAVARYNVDGSLDNSFGEFGRVVTKLNLNISANALAIQPDGKIIVAGTSGVFTAIRYNANGTIDDTFGDKGIVKTSEILHSEIHGVTVQQDGKIVAVGHSYLAYENTIKMNPVIARYNSDGSLDTSFDNDGFVINSENVYSNPAHSVAIQSDDKILTYTGYGIYRYNHDGSKDLSFGNLGKINFDIYQRFSTLSIQPDGKIVAAVYTQLYGNAVLRFNYDGTLDTSFNRTGAVNINGRVTSVTIQADMKIVVAQESYGCSSITRVNSNGEIDKTYNGNGTSVNCHPYNMVDRVSVVTQPDLKIVTTMLFSFNDSNRDFALDRHNIDGSYDAEFGVNGQVTTGDFTGNAYMTSMAMQPDGKIIATGFSNLRTAGITPILVARYNTNGTLDNTFGYGGKVKTPIGTPFSFARAYSVAVQPDGKIVVAGEATDVGCSNCFAVIRYNQNGSLDTSFDNDGIVLINIGLYQSIRSVFIQPDRKILAVSFRAMIRYNPDGSLDSSFGNNGILYFQNDVSVHVSGLQDDGKIVIGGAVFSNSTSNFILTRYNSDGSVDATFGENGQVLMPVKSNTYISSLRIQTDGKIVVSGYSPSSSIIVRFNSDGSLDTSFDGDGKLFTQIARNYSANSIEIQKDGKIVFTGTANGDFPQFLVARFNVDGSTDSSFGKNGVARTVILGKMSNANNVLIQPNGKIVVGGSVDGTFGLMRFQGTPVVVNGGISGRVTTTSGRGIQNVSVKITGGNLSEPKIARTNNFGYYRIPDLEVGETYVVSIASKRYSFSNPTRIITLNEDLTGEDFVSDNK